jgi:hypothetical protein
MLQGARGIRVGWLLFVVVSACDAGTEEPGSAMTDSGTHARPDTGTDPQASSPDAGPANQSQADGGPPSRTDPPRCDCASLDCGTAGACHCSGELARCACEPGHDGARCERCAPGYGRANDDRCVARLTLTRPEPAGSQCAAGGIAVVAGLDADDDGALAGDEVISTSYLCSPLLEPPTCTGDRCSGSATQPARLLTRTPEPRGTACPSGGYLVHIGYDLDDDGVLDPAEIDTQLHECFSSVVRAGPITVSNQAQLDDLSGVTEISSNLTITAPHVRSLEALATLTRIGGNLSITNNGELASLSGLDNLNEIAGTLTVTNNPVLSAIDGFDRVRRVGALVITRNPALTSLDGFRALEAIGGVLTLEDNAALERVTGLGALRSVVGAFRVVNNDALLDLDGLGALHAVAQMTVSGNDALRNLDGLSSLIETLSLIITNNAALEDISGLSALRSVAGAFQIQGNASLAHLDALDALEVVDLDLLIRSNASLASIDGFPRLLHIGQALEIGANAQLQTIGGFSDLRSIGQVISVPDSCLVYPYIFPCTPPPEPASPGLILRIADNPELHEINGFGSLREIGRQTLPPPSSRAVFIERNASLEMLGGFEALGTIGLLSLRELPALDTLTAFSALHTADTVVFEGTGLGHIDLPRLQNTQQLHLTGNVQLSDLNESFPALTLVGALTNSSAWSGHVLSIVDNPALTSAHGFAALTEVRGRLIIEDNPLLAALPDAPSLTRVGSLHIRNNARLDGGGFSALATVSGVLMNIDAWPGTTTIALQIEGNPSLSSLAFASTIITVPTTGFSLRLIDNDALTSLVGLQNITTMSWLFIEENDALVSLAGYSGTAARVSLVNNAQLPTCAAQAFAVACGATASLISGNDDTGVCP